MAIAIAEFRNIATDVMTGDILVQIEGSRHPVRVCSMQAAWWDKDEFVRHVLAEVARRKRETLFSEHRHDRGWPKAAAA